MKSRGVSANGSDAHCGVDPDLGVPQPSVGALRARWRVRVEERMVARVLKSSIDDQVVVCTDINLPIDHKWWRELDRTSQRISRGILVCVIQLG